MTDGPIWRRDASPLTFEEAAAIWCERTGAPPAFVDVLLERHEANMRAARTEYIRTHLKATWACTACTATNARARSHCSRCGRRHEDTMPAHERSLQQQFAGVTDERLETIRQTAWAEHDYCRVHNANEKMTAAAKRHIDRVEAEQARRRAESAA